eukprot:scaffold4140_cov81-Cylindrotheca_fusiformis.AAC.3
MITHFIRIVFTRRTTSNGGFAETADVVIKLDDLHLFACKIHSRQGPQCKCMKNSLGITTQGRMEQWRDFDG